MADARRVVNPLLELVTEPRKEKVTGGSKDPKKIIPEVYARRKQNLLNAIDAIADAPETKYATHGGHILLWAGMAKDSLATTHTPDDLFDDGVGARLVSAWQTGYVVDIKKSGLDELVARIRKPTSNLQRCDIFRIMRLELFATKLKETATIDADWAMALDSGRGLRAFSVALPAFKSSRARKSVINQLRRLASDDTVLLQGPSTPQLPAPAAVVGEESVTATWLSQGAQEARLANIEARWPRRVVLGASNPNTLIRLIESGTIVRWEPVRTLQPILPGAGPEPDLVLPALTDEPIVGVIDGGYHARRYAGAIAWRQTPEFVPDHHAARQHGNKVASIVVDGHLWNNHLNIPPMHCRVGIVQGVPARGAAFFCHYSELVRHIEQAFRDHPDTYVWNLSANIDGECDPWSVSDLGHLLSVVARRNNKLLVISAGNRDDNRSRVSPPADCDAALVVGGRLHDEKGNVAGPCVTSRTGLGPEGMLKPEASWFSHHRVLGGSLERGTSYSTPLVSRLAAHTWKNVAKATPDLVRALLINSCDGQNYSHAIGFGSPINPEEPWLCPPNAVVFAWSETIQSRLRYYWTGIRIPPSMIKKGRLIGKLRLVAILEPVVQTVGHHYISTRLETGIQLDRTQVAGAKKNLTLVGCMNPQQREDYARRDDHKWHPVRVYQDEFTQTNGPRLTSTQPTLQVYARVYWRNAFQYSEEIIRDTLLRVHFVVTLESPDATADTYNEFTRIMASDVQSAVVTQDVEVDEEN